MMQILQEAEIIQPTKIFLVKTSLEAIEKRLTERNNEIDNKIKANKENFCSLYNMYYHEAIKQFTNVELLINEKEDHLQQSINTIQDAIVILLKEMTL